MREKPSPLMILLALGCIVFTWAIITYTLYSIVMVETRPFQQSLRNAADSTKELSLAWDDLMKEWKKNR